MSKYSNLLFIESIFVEAFYKKMGKISYSIQIIKEYSQYFFLQ